MPDPVPFVHEPDGASPIVFSFEFPTSMIDSETGREQRARLRQHPTGALKFESVLFGQEAQTLAATLYRSQAGTWAVPLWPFPNTTTADAAPGATSIDGLYYYNPMLDEGGWGQYALLWKDFATYELVAITGISLGTSLTLSAPLAGTWPAGSTIYPVRIGRLPSSVKFARVGHDGRKGEFAFEFENVGPFIGTLDDPDVASDPRNEDGNFYWELGHVDPEGGADVDEEFPRLFEVLYETIGAKASETFDVAPRAAHTFLWKIGEGFPPVIGALQWIYYRRGRAVPFWLPPWQQEIELVADTAAGATEIVIKRIGYAANLFPGTNARRWIQFRTPIDADPCIVGVASAVDNLDGTETLSLSPALPFDVTRAQLAGFRRFCRLDADRIDISFEGDYAEIPLPIRELPLETPSPEPT